MPWLLGGSAYQLTKQLSREEVFPASISGPGAPVPGPRLLVGAAVHSRGVAGRQVEHGPEPGSSLRPVAWEVSKVDPAVDGQIHFALVGMDETL